MDELSSLPVIQRPPVSMEAYLLRTVNLTCLVDGSLSSGYRWLKDGILITGETREILYIKEILPEDRGNYTCMVISGTKQAMSDQAQLNISGKLDRNKCCI